MKSNENSVSVVVRRRIRPELVEAYEEWLAGVIEAAETFEGHQGAQVLRPSNPATQDYVFLFRYATPEQLAAWQESETARDWLKRGEAFTLGDVQIQTITGLEFWFQIPTGASHRPPAKHKMVIATVIGLYPLILFLAPILANALQVLPRPLAVLMSTLCNVLLMTYVVMPRVTRGLSRWLFPRRLTASTGTGRPMLH
ncbi:MAG: antibiotic biosynthesis monooxygenase [Planctomycetota bacterium]